MPDIAPDPLQELLARLREARAAAAHDPFGDPVLLIALAISRRLDDGALDLEAIGHLVQGLADAAAGDRAGRIAAYVGLPRGGAPGSVPDLATLAARLVRPDPEDSPVPFAQYRSLVETPRFAAVSPRTPPFPCRRPPPPRWPRPPPAPPSPPACRTGPRRRPWRRNSARRWRPSRVAATPSTA